MADATHERACAAIAEAFWGRFEPAELGLTAGYWPIRREVDCLRLLSRIIDAGGAVALPAVVGPRSPLEFRPWTPETPMAGGRYEIPHPAEGPPVRPATILIPLVGFDAAGHRLGYGGGYYDRTLAALTPARVIGLGFELGRLPKIQPGPHDQRMDLIITEAGAFEPI
ncbi:MAG: 5-formyltetrahydrofolate cyclo-ligase [Caulobacteraceae bacterium]|nr:5-formyltetrahydrofolate cyclo-ligase [Caulobacteraceae bacterium]